MLAWSAETDPGDYRGKAYEGVMTMIKAEEDAEKAEWDQLGLSERA